MKSMNLLRRVALVAAFASLAASLGACHSRASDAIYRSTHSRHK